MAKKILFRKLRSKDCFRQCRYIYDFETKVDEEFVKFLESFGQVIVYRDFTIPLVRMDVERKFRLTTLMGSNSIDIFFKETAPKSFESSFDKKLNSFLIH